MPRRIVSLMAAGLLLSGCSAVEPAAVGPLPAATSPPAAATTTPARTSPVPTALGSPATATGTVGAPRPARNPLPGNASGMVTVPTEGRAEGVSRPDRVVGTGTAASCTSAAFVAAVAKGGVITFDCGRQPVTITLARTATVRNTSSRVVIDGGNRVTLSGGGTRRILYLDTCDAAVGYTTSHCQDQETPRLTVQNIAFTRGNSTGQTQEGGGGGAIFDRGGRLKIVNTRFTGNRCDTSGPDLGGAAVRVLDQSRDRPVYVVGSTFTGGSCSNGGGLSSIGVSWTILNSVFTGNEAIGRGANPARGGTPGGGSGGAIYADGNLFTIRVAGSRIEGNHAREGGGAVFFVSNDRTGTLAISSSTLRRNPSDGFENSPGIFFLGRAISR